MLYPLNALIESQRERFSAWTQPFGGKVRYCLYNGDLPRAAKESERRRTPEEVTDRERLRANPPPLLVTNITMLEYMLVRADRPLHRRFARQAEMDCPPRGPFSGRRGGGRDRAAPAARPARLFRQAGRRSLRRHLGDHRARARLSANSFSGSWPTLPAFETTTLSPRLIELSD